MTWRQLVILKKIIFSFFQIFTGDDVSKYFGIEGYKKSDLFHSIRKSHKLSKSFRQTQATWTSSSMEHEIYDKKKNKLLRFNYLEKKPIQLTELI